MLSRMKWCRSSKTINACQSFYGLSRFQEFDDVLRKALVLTGKAQAAGLYRCGRHPDQPRRRGRAVILIAQNDEDNIYERVSRALLNSAGVVVLDYGSTDGTPYFAAEAGALVVIKEPHQAEEEAMAAAYRAVQRFST